jgi:hypothetical protein
MPFVYSLDAVHESGHAGYLCVLIPSDPVKKASGSLMTISKIFNLLLAFLMIWRFKFVSLFIGLMMPLFWLALMIFI